MMHVVPQWKVVVRFAAREDVVFWISNNYVSNVLRQLADLQFTGNGLEQPTQIVIGSSSPAPNEQATSVSQGRL